MRSRSPAAGTSTHGAATQYGQLGNGTWQDSSTPVLVSSLTDVVGIFAGRDHNLAVRSDGSVWSWGYNRYGELGDGTGTSRNAPVRVVRLNGSALGNIVQVGAGANHSLALRSDGTLWAWGRNNFGQLGDGTFSARHRAVKVMGLSGVEQMAGGRQNSIAVTTGGEVYTWGENVYGQLGDGTVSATGRNIPGKVAGLSNVSAVGMGRDYGMAIVVPANSSRQLPHRHVLRALAREGLAVPSAPAFAQPHPGERRHQVELRGPHVAERDGEALELSVHTLEVM